MNYFKTDEEAIVEFVNFYKSVVIDLSDLSSSLFRGKLARISNEDISPFNEKRVKKWLSEANELVSNFTKLRDGHIAIYKDLLERSSKLQLIEIKIKNDERIVDLMIHARSSLRQISHGASELLLSPVVKEISDPIEKQVRAIADIHVNDYLDSSFILEGDNFFGIPSV